MSNLNIYNFLFLLSFAYVTCNPLLKIVQLCDKQSPNFQKCAVDEANRVTKILANSGDGGILNLKTFKFANITYENDFVIELFDGNLNGLDTFTATNVKPEWNDRKWSLDGTFDKFELQSTCKIVGNVLDKQLNGKGSINIVMENVIFNDDAFLTFTKKEDKEIYIKKANNIIHLDAKNIKITFTDIFGDAAKDKEFNDYVNENIATGKKELIPIVETVVGEYFIHFQKIFLGKTPFKNVFLNYK